MRLPLGPWHPDNAVLDSDVLADVRGALWSGGSWSPDASLQPVIDAAIPSPVQGMVTLRRSDGSLELYVAANGRIWKVPSKVAALVSAGKVAGYSAAAADRWRFVQFGTQLVGTNLTDSMQAFDLAAGGLFADLSASAPRAKFIAVVKDQIMVGHTIDGVNGEDVFQVRWHGFQAGLPDPTYWTPDPQSLSDFQRLADVGQITGLTGGEWGTVVCEGGIVRASFVGAPYTYQFDTVERRIGCRLPESVVQHRQVTYFWSPSGFMAFDGGQLRPIGVQKVDNWFADDFDEDRGSLMWSGIDPVRQDVMWLYAGKGNDGTKANRLIRYSVPFDEFMVSDVAAQAIGPGRTFGLDLDDPAAFPDLDLDARDLDDPSLWSSLPNTLAVAGGLVSSFSGPPADGSFTLAERSLVEDRRALLRGARIIRDGGASTLRVGARQRWGGDLALGPTYGEQSDGTIRFREPGRTHVLRVGLSGGWNRALGLEADATPLGLR